MADTETRELAGLMLSLAKFIGFVIDMPNPVGTEDHLYNEDELAGWEGLKEELPNILYMYLSLGMNEVQHDKSNSEDTVNRVLGHTDWKANQ